MYGILLQDREVQCQNCDQGTFTDLRGSQHVCRVCNGKGFIPMKEQLQHIIGKLRPALKRAPLTSVEFSVMLRFTDAEDCLFALQALQYHRIRARLFLENNYLTIKRYPKAPSRLLQHELANTT